MKLSIVLLACLVCAACAADANQKVKTAGVEDLAKEKRGAAKSTVTVGVQQPVQQLEYVQPQQADVAYVHQPQQQVAYLQAQPQLQYLQAQPQLQQLQYLQAQPQVPLTYLQAQPQPQVAYLQPQQQLLSYAQPQQQQPTVTYYSQEQQQLPQRSLSPQQLYAKYQSAPRTPAQTSAAVAEYLQGGQSQSLALSPAAGGIQYPQIPVASLGLGYSSLINAVQQQPLLELSGAAHGAGYEVNPPPQTYRAPPPQAVQGRGLQIYQQPYIAQIQAQAESAQRQLNALYQQQQQQQQQLLQQQQILQPQQEVKG